jgi:hypothetical protein
VTDYDCAFASEQQSEVVEPGLVLLGAAQFDGMAETVVVEASSVAAVVEEHTLGLAEDTLAEIARAWLLPLLPNSLSFLTEPEPGLVLRY